MSELRSPEIVSKYWDQSCDTQIEDFTSSRTPFEDLRTQPSRLARTIETEIIPRLMLAHSAQPGSSFRSPDRAFTPSPQDISELGRLVRAHDDSVAHSYIEAMQKQGATLESLYLDLLAPAARHLGDLWSEDLCDFTEVTIGLGRLQAILRELSPGFRDGAHVGGRGRRALLVPTPGEQHLFGVVMVGEFLRRAGWDVWSEPAASTDDIAGIVQNEHYDVIGFSISGEQLLEHLTSAIRTIRRSSCNRAMGVMVGGQLFVEHPDLVRFVGADTTATDGRRAVIQAQALVEMSAQS